MIGVILCVNSWISKHCSQYRSAFQHQGSFSVLEQHLFFCSVQFSRLIVSDFLQPQNTADIIDLAVRIGNRSRMRIDMLINNTNLADLTEPGMIENGERVTLTCAEKLGVNAVITAGKEEILEKCRLHTPIMKIRRYMAPEWMEHV